MSRNSNMLPPTVFMVDFQAFQHGSEDFTVKELCVIDTSKPQRPMYAMYLPPCPYTELSREQRRTYDYQANRLHRLGWDEGYMHFCKECLKRAMERWLFTTNNRELSVFYAMGQQKVDFLQRLLPDCKIMNYQDAFNVARSSDMPVVPPGVHCIHREHGDYCAVKRCYSMYLHFISL